MLDKPKTTAKGRHKESHEGTREQDAKSVTNLLNELYLEKDALQIALGKVSAKHEKRLPHVR